ncbi:MULTISPECIES: hypothetical protein [Lactiplantibacillus]|uniref:Uncharacterized protein n=1 Tax=Bifidobacterium longum TaxID=216816 RepID=A0A6B1XEE0_BIFLN|nr:MULTISPECIES: hypothetical protein [Lactiplantibacillus]MZU09638.1 hypothetical protein [Bifidobacterium longum]MBA3076698.1 hypothetical protein [Lactiplantibacillus plantarum]MBA3082498.1 hypothetical protein [Lactiplantibacillus plantarum]MCC9314291.1 hypothetical protein [Lactiplantibacillus plantarum]MDO1604025.1 hypothetical protein [Lactiplantibacillus plantarum]
MFKIIEQLVNEILHGNLVSINRSNEDLDDGQTLAHYDFNVKVKTPTSK